MAHCASPPLCLPACFKGAPCLCLCAGTGCQPAGYDVTKQRAIVLKKDGCTDDWSLWMLQGHRIRNKQTGWCMDTSLLGR